jgi:hypothetical protein
MVPDGGLFGQQKIHQAPTSKQLRWQMAMEQLFSHVQAGHLE